MNKGKRQILVGLRDGLKQGMLFFCNRLPGGIVCRSVAESYRLYRNDKTVMFYKTQFFHNIKTYCIPSRRYCSMKYALTEKSVPDVLFHITKAENTASILQNGLVAKYNPAVFLTDSEAYIDFLKERYPKDGYAVFKIHAAKMEQDGCRFFNERQSDRSIIWVTRAVLPQYLEIVDI